MHLLHFLQRLNHQLVQQKTTIPTKAPHIFLPSKSENQSPDLVLDVNFRFLQTALNSFRDANSLRDS